MKIISLLLLLSLAFTSHAQTSATGTTEEEYHFQVYQSLNTHAATLKTDIGFTKWEKASYELDSAFSSLYADYFGYIYLNKSWAFIPFFIYEYYHYSDLEIEKNPEHRGTKVADFEQEIYAQFNFEKTLKNKNKLKLGIHYNYIDDFFDPTIFDTEIYSIKYKSHSASLTGGYEWKIDKDLRLKSSIFAEREMISDSEDDLNRYTLRNYLYWTPKKKSKIRFGYSYAFYDYDDRPSRLKDGTAIENKTTRTNRHAMSVKWDQSWNKSNDLKTKLYLKVNKESDHAEGYYDYMRYSLKLNVEYSYAKWKFELMTKAAYKDYKSKTAEDGSKKWLLYYRASQTTSYKLKENLLAYFKYELYDDHSNEIYDKRIEHWFKIGLEWEI